MIETLKKIYKDNFIDNIVDYDFLNFHYFIDEKQYIFGISKKAISVNELKLILTHYKLLTKDIKPEKFDYIIDFLFGKRKNLPKFSKLKYYFIKFVNIPNEEEYIEVDNLFEDLFKEYLCYVKINNIYIIVVNETNGLYFLDILKSIESDFLIPTIGFESEFYQVDSNLPTYFQYDYHAFIKYNKTNNLLLNKTDLIKNQIFSNIDNKLKEKLKSYVLKSLINDTEMLNVVKTYFETNLNTTLASKLCYMHRNTFINKIDKFIEITQFNIRNYQEALIVYLSIII